MDLEMKASGRITDAATLCALAGVAALFWWCRIIAPATQHAFAGFDHYGQIYPMTYRAAQRLLAGDLPLWNPYQYAGHPFLATALYGLLYPPNVLFLVLRTEVAMEVLAVLHLAAAGGFTYLYGRAIGLGWFGAVAAGLTFMLSDFMASQAAWFLPAIASAAWLPLGLLAIERLFAERRPRWMAVLAIAVAMPLLAGWAQTWVYSALTLAAYLAARSLVSAFSKAERCHLPGVCALAAAGFALGMALTAAQLLPTIELQRLGPRRPGALTVEQMMAFGVVAPAIALAQAVDSTPGAPRVLYLGTIALLLAPLALLARRQRFPAAFLCGAALLSVAVTLAVTPVFDLYRRIPPLGWFRVPARIVFLYAFAGAVLAGIGLDTIARCSEAGAARRRPWHALACASVGLALICALPMPAWSRGCIGLGIALVVGAAFCGEAMRRVLVVSLLVVLSIDLFHSYLNRALHPFSDLTLFDREAGVFDYVKQHQGLFRTYLFHRGSPSDPPMAKQGTLREIYSVTDYEPLSIGRYERFFGLMQPPRPRAGPFTGHLLAANAVGLRLLDLMSVRFALASRKEPIMVGTLITAGWKMVATGGGGDFVAWENPAPLARAYVAHDPMFVADEDQALREVGAPAFDPRRRVVLERGQGDAEPLTPAREGEAGIVEASMVSYEPEQVTIETDDPRPGYLVLTDSFYPGWQARVDEREATILQANYLFRAVRVPAGKHRVTFEYRPWTFRWGAVISGAALLVLVAVAVAEVARGRSSGAVARGRR